MEDRESELLKLAHRHVTVSYVVIGVLIFVLTAAFAGAYAAGKWFNEELAKARADEATLRDDIQTYREMIAKDEAQGQADSAKQNVIVKVIHDGHHRRTENRAGSCPGENSSSGAR